MAYALVEEAQNFSTSVLSPGLLMVHDSIRRRQHDVAELARRQQVSNPLLDLIDADIKSGRNNPALVKPTDKIDHDLPSSVVINELEFANIPMGLHDLQEFD